MDIHTHFNELQVIIVHNFSEQHAANHFDLLLN